MNKLRGRNKTSMHVHQTNDEATLSKRSANKIEYFDDPVLKYFCKKLLRRTTLINRVYTYRVKIIRKLLQSFLDSFCSDVQVVNIGSGFDSSIFASQVPDPSRLTYFEIDLVDVIEKKRTLLNTAISSSEAKVSLYLQKILDRTRFICSDLSSPISALNALEDEGFNSYRPTFFIAECVLQYVSPCHSISLLQELSKRYAITKVSAYVTIFDQIQPNDAFGNVMQLNLKKRSSELHGIKSFDSPRALRCRLHKTGWIPACIPFIQVINFLKELDYAEQSRIENLEPFDEFEDFFETCRHYCLSIGAINLISEENSIQSVISQLADHSISGLNLNVAFSRKETSSIKKFYSIPSIEFFGFGHTSLNYNSPLFGERILTFGGFSKHGSRTSDTHIFDVDRKSTSAQWFDTNKPTARMQHSMSSMYSIEVFARDVVIDGLSFLYSDDNHHNIYKTNHILLFGGRGGPDELFGDSFIFDGDTEMWAPVEYIDINTVPSPRYRHDMVTLEPSNGSKYLAECHDGRQFLSISKGIFVGSVLLFGGREDKLRCSNDLWIFCSVKRKWLPVEYKGDVPEGRHSHAMCYDPKGKKVYLSGGLASSGKVLDDIYSFDMETLEWTRIYHSAELQLFSHTMTLVSEYQAIFFVGGVTPMCGFWDDHSTIRLLHLSDLSITEANTIPQVCGHQTVYLKSKQSLFIIGGGLQCFSFGCTYNDSFVVELDLPLQQYTKRITSIDCHSCVVSTDQWEKSLYSSRLPIHFENMHLGSCVEKWFDYSYLSLQEKQTRVIVHEYNGQDLKGNLNGPYRMDFINKNFIYTHKSFSELIEDCFVNKKPTYYRSIARQDKVCDFWSSFPSIASDFQAPDVFDGTITPERYFQSCLRVSSANIQLWTHYDIMDNILCQIVGQKRVLLYPPGTYSIMKMKDSVSEILDMSKEDNRDARQQQIELILNPGDVLFIPALWLHTIITLTSSIGINIFWRHLDASAYSSKDNYGNHDLPSMMEAKERVIRFTRDVLKEVPKEYQKFTLHQILDKLGKF